MAAAPSPNAGIPFQIPTYRAHPSPACTPRPCPHTFARPWRPGPWPQPRHPLPALAPDAAALTNEVVVALHVAEQRVDEQQHQLVVAVQELGQSQVGGLGEEGGAGREGGGGGGGPCATANLRAMGGTPRQ